MPPHTHGRKVNDPRGASRKTPVMELGLGTSKTRKPGCRMKSRQVPNYMNKLEKKEMRGISK